MRKPIIAIKLRPFDYKGWINLGNRIVVSLTANANFTTPAVSTANLQLAITAVDDALALWAPIGSRGSKSDLLDLRSKTVTLAQLLRSEAQYVQLTAQLAAGNDFETMAAIIGTSGYELSAVPAPVGLLQAVVGFEIVKSLLTNSNQVMFRWNKPLDVKKGDVNIYRILRATTANFSAASEIGTSTKTSFVDTNATGAVQTYTYWVVAVNNFGDGAVSNAITVKVLDL
jgi:hypothetical protein